MTSLKSFSIHITFILALLVSQAKADTYTYCTGNGGDCCYCGDTQLCMSGRTCVTNGNCCDCTYTDGSKVQNCSYEETS